MRIVDHFPVRKAVLFHCSMFIDPGLTYLGDIFSPVVVYLLTYVFGGPREHNRLL